MTFDDTVEGPRVAGESGMLTRNLEILASHGDSKAGEELRSRKRDRYFQTGRIRCLSIQRVFRLIEFFEEIFIQIY